MKKLFTLVAAFAASVGMLSAQTTITWPLQDKDDLSGKSSEASITVGTTTYGSSLTPVGTATINSKDGDPEVKGVVFYTSDTNEHKTPTSDGSHYLTFTFTIPDGYTFTPTNLSFGACKNGTGNNHFGDISINNVSVESKYTFVRDSEGGGTPTISIKDFDALEGKVTLLFNLYSKPTKNTAKGWVIGNLVLTGNLADKSDTREDAPISWNPESVSLKVRDNFTSPVFVNDENLPVTFTSNDETIATVSETGEISLVEGAIGTAVITASYDGEAEGAKYRSTVANTTIEVLTNVVKAYKWDSPSDEYVEMDDIKLNKEFKAGKTSGTTSADNKLINDTNILARTVFGAKYASSASYLGRDFAGSLQLGRVKTVPSADTPTGVEESGSSPLEVTAKTDLQLVVFYRRQGLEQEAKKTIEDDETNNVITETHVIGMSANDGKSLYCVDQTAVDAHLPCTLVLGKFDGEANGNDYIYCASIWNLEAGKTYTLYSYQTTIQCHGFGYILPSIDAPVIKHGETEIADEIVLEGEDKELVITPADEAHHIYYHFAPAEENQPQQTPEVEGPGEMTYAKATAEGDVAETLEHEGKTFTHAPEKKITLSKAGTLSILAYHPETDIKSEVKTITVSGSGTSGIADIAVDAANGAVEYFNLQGIRVDNPAEGIFIRREGNKVSKVIVK